MNARNRLLIIDDDPDLRTLLRLFAESHGYSVAEGGAGDDTLELYAEVQPTIIFLDLSMPERDGVEMLRELAQRGCTAPIVLTSGASERLLAAAKRIGRELGLMIPYVLTKPINERYLRGVLSRAWQEDWTPTAEELEAAIAGDQMVVHYQPKLALHPQGGTSILGCEAIIRWQHPERGLQPPSRFMPVAEEWGLTTQLMDSMIDQVVMQMQDWGKDRLELPVSVGLSPAQLNNIDLPADFSGRLKKAGLDPAHMILQVTEPAIRANASVSIDILTRMLLKGFGIALDDFGAVGSSVSEIYRLPLSEVKIDHVITRAAEADLDARIVFKSFVDLAHAFGLKVCAKGVETERGAEYCRSIGCDAAQGFLFSPPLPAPEFVAFAKKAMVEGADVSPARNVA